MISLWDVYGKLTLLIIIKLNWLVHIAPIESDFFQAWTVKRVQKLWGVYGKFMSSLWEVDIIIYFQIELIGAHCTHKKCSFMRGELKDYRKLHTSKSTTPAVVPFWQWC